MADVLRFQPASPSIDFYDFYDRRAIEDAKADIRRAIATIQAQALMTCDKRELAIFELTLEQCAVYAVSAREFIAELPGTVRSVES